MDDLSPETQKTVLDAIASGRKILAIKRYKDATGCDLKTSKEVVESLIDSQPEAGPDRFAGEFPGVDDDEAGLILDAIYEGRKIDAVKRYQNATGRRLKASKEFIEELTARLKQESPDQFQPATGTGCASSILLVAVMILFVMEFGDILSAAIMN